MTNVLSMEGMSCEELYNRLQALLENIKGLIGDVKTMLRNIKDMLNYPFRRLLAILDEYLGALNNLNLLDFSNLNKVINALKKMLDCPYLARIVGDQVEAILDSISKGPAKIMQMLKSMLQGIADRIQKSIEPIRMMLQSPIDKLSGTFDKFVNSSPITTVLTHIAQIQECLGSMCAAYKAVKEFSPGTIIKPLESWGIKYVSEKDENGRVTRKLDCSGVKDALRSKCTDMKNKGKESWEKSKETALKKIDEIDKGLAGFNKRIRNIKGAATPKPAAPATPSAPATPGAGSGG